MGSEVLGDGQAQERETATRLLWATPARPSTTKAAPSQSGRGVLKEGCTTTSTAVVHSRTDDHDDRSAAALSSQQEASSHRNISTAAASNSTRGGSASAFLGPSQTSGRGGSHHHYLPKVERSAVVSKRSRTPAEQAQFLKYFLADSIVEDLECFRRLYFASTPENSEHQGIGESASGRWSVLGQSYGGFIGVRYLSQYPEALDRVLFTGGLPPPMQCPVDRVYAATCRRLSERNREFYSRYPEDVWRVRVLCKYLELHDIRLPIGGAFGGRLSPRRFLQLGLCLGTQTGLHSMHAVLRSAFEEPFRSVYLRQTMQAASEIQQRAETLAKNITDSYGTVERRDQFRAAAAQLKVLSGAGTGSQAQVIERPVVESSHFQQKEEQAQAQRQPVSSTASTKATRRRRDSVNKRGVCEDADAGAVYSDACSSSFDTSSDDDGRPRDDGCGRRRRRRRRGKLSMDAPPVLDLADLLQNQDQSVNKNTYPEVDQDHIENTPKPKVRMQPDEVSSSAALPGCVPQYLLTPCSCSAHGAFDASTSAATGEAAGGLLKTPKSSPKRPASHEDDNEDSSDERREFVGLGTSCTTQSTPAKALLDVGAKKIGKRRRKAPLEVQSQHWEGEAEHSKSTNICTPRDLFTGTSTSSTSFRSSPLQQHEHSSVNTVLQDQTNASSVFSSAASVTTSSSTPCQSPHQAQPNSQAPLNPPLPQSTVHDRLSTTAPPGPIGTLDLEPNRVSTAASAIGTPGCAGSLVSAPPGTASLMPPPSRTSEILSSEESIMNHPALLLGPRGGAQLSRAFLTAMGNAQPFESQPLYALLQESIYMTEPGCSSGWSAARTIASEQHREDFWYHELKRSCSEDVTTEVGSSSNLVVTSTPLLANTENPTVTMKVNYQHAHDDDISCAAACSPSAYDSTGCAASAFDSTGCACAAALEPAEVATQHQHGNQYDHRNAAPPRTLASQSTPEFPLRWWDDEQFSGRPLFFTSEMVFPWMFSKDFIGLQPLRDCMMALHKETEWPQMYDLSSYQQLHANLRTFLNAEERMIAQYLENEKAVVFTSQEDYTDELVLRPGDPNHARGTSASTSSIEKSQSALSTPGRRDSLSFHSCVEDEVTPGIIRSSPQRVAVVDTKAKNTWTTGCEVLKTGKTSCSSASLYSPCKSTGQHVHPTLLSEQDSAQQSPLLSSTSREDPHAADVKKRVRTTLREIKAPPHCPTCAAVVYYDDMYVERELSEETAAQIPGIRLWVTNEYHHSGLLDDGFVLLDRLLAMCEQAECEEK
ncbi:unnamed protein product [Amoebophrya sp. A25]|nr:unnamed protein product [Amoebophrya sp. A25]|eukprot:GSA25T00011561001.1